ncbi:MFS transporter [Naasia sp. SYSU D00057]|uniref:MFS transporter n=1 Tax=Naasia sp. SYSU D00057 TaxID=2817380 RepID=UPI001B311B1C|nr:MFS transporter [Naasia sp. SYSU D00057]
MSQSVAAERASLVRWRNAVFVVFAVAGFSLASWLARVPAIRESLGITTGQTGFLILGCSAGAILGLLLASPVLHLVGSRRAVAGSQSFAAVGIVLIGVGSEVFGSYAITFAGLAIFGIGSGLSDVAMNVEGAAAERRSGKSMLPLFHAFFSLGSVAGAGAGALVAQARVPMSVQLTAVGVLLVVAVLVAVPALLADRLEAERRAGEGGERLRFAERMAVWVEPRTLLLGVVALGMAFAEGGANDWLALAMVDERGASHASGALLLAVFTASMTAGRLLGGRVLDRYGRVPVLRVSAAMAVAGLLLVIFVDQTAVTVVGVVLWGLGCALGFPVSISAATDDPAKAAARVSVVSTVGYLAFLAGPPLIGVLGDAVGLLRALLIVGALIALAGVLAFAARETRQPERIPAGAE